MAASLLSFAALAGCRYLKSDTVVAGPTRLTFHVEDGALKEPHRLVAEFQSPTRGLHERISYFPAGFRAADMERELPNWVEGRWPGVKAEATRHATFRSTPDQALDLVFPDGWKFTRFTVERLTPQGFTQEGVELAIWEGERRLDGAATKE